MRHPEGRHRSHAATLLEHPVYRPAARKIEGHSMHVRRLLQRLRGALRTRSVLALLYQVARAGLSVMRANRCEPAA
jgi:hypothetical protein